MRLIDADSQLKDIRQHLEENKDKESLYFKLLEELIEWVKGFPTIDAVPVIRCQNCKRCDGFSSADIQPNEIGICKINMMGVKPTDFCSYGEPRGERKE